MLSPCLVHNDARRVREVEGTSAGQHGDADTFGHVRVGHHLLRQPGGLWTEQQNVAGLIVDVGVERVGMGGEGENPLWGKRTPGSEQVLVHGHRRHVVVVEPGTLHLGFGQVESQRFHQV